MNGFQYEQEMIDYEREVKEWLLWVERATKLMRDRQTPKNASELSQLLAELHRFKSDDMPPKLADKNRLSAICAELEVLIIIIISCAYNRAVP